MPLSSETLLRARDWVAYGYRQALLQNGIVETGPAGLTERDLTTLVQGTWAEVEAKALAELWEATGGPEVGQYVLAQTVHESIDEGRTYRSPRWKRFRIVKIREDGTATATEAWSMASEKTEHRIALDSALYVG